MLFHDPSHLLEMVENAGLGAKKQRWVGWCKEDGIAFKNRETGFRWPWLERSAHSVTGTLAAAARRRNHVEALLNPESKDSIEKVPGSATEIRTPSWRSHPGST